MKHTSGPYTATSHTTDAPAPVVPYHNPAARPAGWGRGFFRHPDPDGGGAAGGAADGGAAGGTTGGAADGGGAAGGGAAGGAADGGAAGGGTGGAGDAQPRLYTEAEVEARIQARTAQAARAKAEAERAAKAEAERKRLAAEGQYQQLLDMTKAEAAAKEAALQAEIAAERARVADLTIQTRLERATAKAVNPAQAAALMRDAVALDDKGQVVVKGPNGVPLLDTNGRPMTLETYAEDWLRKNPHFLPASQARGGGTTAAANEGAAGGVKFDPALAHDIEHVRAATPDIERLRAEKWGGGQ